MGTAILIRAFMVLDYFSYTIIICPGCLLFAMVFGLRDAFVGISNLRSQISTQISDLNSNLRSQLKSQISTHEQKPKNQMSNEKSQMIYDQYLLLRFCTRQAPIIFLYRLAILCRSGAFISQTQVCLNTLLLHLLA